MKSPQIKLVRNLDICIYLYTHARKHKHTLSETHESAFLVVGTGIHTTPQKIKVYIEYFSPICIATLRKDNPSSYKIAYEFLLLILLPKQVEIMICLLIWLGDTG